MNNIEVNELILDTVNEVSDGKYIFIYDIKKES